MISKKCGIILFVIIVLCVILAILLGVLLPRRTADNSDSALDLPETSPWYGNEEIKIFREYLRIPTFHPNIDYGSCVQFLKNQASSLDLPVSVFYPADEQNPVVVITWLGSNPELKSIMLNSHTDVVPAYDEFWTYPPFAADIDEEGKIFARGTQDTKGLGMIYLAAIRALKHSGIQQLKRTFHVTFVPDEEVGGALGMEKFALSDEFRALNVGYALDEGVGSTTNVIEVLYDERCPWQIEFVCSGPTGHGSILFENTAGEKLTYLISKLMEMRRTEVERMNNLGLPYGNVTSINLTLLKGGIQGNVVPQELTAIFDVRLAIDVDQVAFEEQINQWCEEAGGNITVNYLVKTPKSQFTTADETNPLWVVLQNTTKEFNITIHRTVAPGATDSRFLRRLSIPSLGFLPLLNTPPLLHEHNEYVQADEYLAGIDVYTKLLSNLGEIE